jgi:hypothetical protein
MTEITKEHVEWAVVDRLRQMLERPSEEFKATETYALFTSALCWVMQHIRIPEREAQHDKDRAVRALWEKLRETPVTALPWEVQTPGTGPIKREERHAIGVPSPRGFADHNVARFLKNLRDAAAHGDARNVSPFNAHGFLLGFTFSCSERGGGGGTAWTGEITLLRSDMQRIGTALCRLYCDAVREGSARLDEAFEADAASIQEEVA